MSNEKTPLKKIYWREDQGRADRRAAVKRNDERVSQKGPHHARGQRRKRLGAAAGAQEEVVANRHTKPTKPPIRLLREEKRDKRAREPDAGEKKASGDCRGRGGRGVGVPKERKLSR